MKGQMTEVMEPEIKLFGRNILLTESGRGNAGKECSVVSSDEEKQKQKQLDCDEDKAPREISDDEGQSAHADEKLQNLDDNPKTPSIEEESTLSKSDNEQSDALNGQQKVLKKPDKILPCPRCSSMDTKFCYYNNYNISQPRHFCKSCQRYWTAGGTMRNLPVGAGRRKNKNSASSCRHIMISEALQASIIDGYKGFPHTTLKPSDTVLSFVPDSRLCKPMASAMKIPDKSVPNDVESGCDVGQGGLGSCKSGADGDDCSVVSSVRSSNSAGKNGLQQPIIQKINPLQSSVSCIPGVPWQLPWNSAVPLPAIFPMQFYPAPFLNYGLPNSWVAPWLTMPPSTSDQKTASCSPNSHLGKHSRNGKLFNPSYSTGEGLSGEQSSESLIVVPKTLRIDDPEEAAKSSIWETLGIKYDFTSRDGLFKALQPNRDQKKAMVRATPSLLQANPAALSRSISFQENS